jgi:hypothetical protein
MAPPLRHPIGVVTIGASGRPTALGSKPVPRQAMAPAVPPRTNGRGSTTAAGPVARSAVAEEAGEDRVGRRGDPDGDLEHARLIARRREVGGRNGREIGDVPEGGGDHTDAPAPTWSPHVVPPRAVALLGCDRQEGAEKERRRSATNGASISRGGTTPASRQRTACFGGRNPLAMTGNRRSVPAPRAIFRPVPVSIPVLARLACWPAWQVGPLPEEDSVPRRGIGPRTRGFSVPGQVYRSVRRCPVSSGVVRS